MIAGILGWPGIWGTGSALVEYLIPVPVAGGFLHVPSFVVATGIILISRRSTGQAIRYLPVLAFSTLAVALSLMLEFDRLHAWLFTDYQPPGSPFRLDGILCIDEGLRATSTCMVRTPPRACRNHWLKCRQLSNEWSNIQNWWANTHEFTG